MLLFVDHAALLQEQPEVLDCKAMIWLGSSYEMGPVDVSLPCQLFERLAHLIAETPVHPCPVLKLPAVSSCHVHLYPYRV